MNSTDYLFFPPSPFKEIFSSSPIQNCYVPQTFKLLCILVSRGESFSHIRRSCHCIYKDKIGTKPQKPKSIKASDKRKISLLNSDFKISTGLEAKKFQKISTHTFSPNQLVAGEDRRMYHGVNLARDAIYAAGKAKSGCGILDTDYMAAFDFLVMLWVFKVLLKKGLSELVISRLKISTLIILPLSLSTMSRVKVF